MKIWLIAYEIQKRTTQKRLLLLAATVPAWITQRLMVINFYSTG